jgi:hypothetical protein
MLSCFMTVSPVDQELLTIPEHLCIALVWNGIHVAQYLIFYAVCLQNPCLHCQHWAHKTQDENWQNKNPKNQKLMKSCGHVLFFYFIFALFFSFFFFINQDLLTIPEHLCLDLVWNGIHVVQYLIFYAVCLQNPCLSRYHCYYIWYLSNSIV